MGTCCIIKSGERSGAKTTAHIEGGANVNRVILMGRLTRDPEVRYSRGDQPIAIARYTLAVDRRGRRTQNGEQQTADFIPCVAFDRAGEFAEKYFRQGMRVLVSGRIQTGSYTNRDGQKVYTTEIVVDEQEFADSKGTGHTQEQSQGQAASQTKLDNRLASGRNAMDTEGFMDIPEGIEDEGLPFS